MSGFKNFNKPGIINWLIALTAGALVAVTVFLLQSFFTGLYYAKLEESLRTTINNTELDKGGSFLQIGEDRKYKKLFPTNNIVNKRFFGVVAKIEKNDYAGSFLAVQDPVLKASRLAQSASFQALVLSLQKIADEERRVRQQGLEFPEFAQLKQDVINSIRGCLIGLGVVRDLSNLTVSSYYLLKKQLSKFGYNFPELHR